jgi:hypothetical protein
MSKVSGPHNPDDVLIGFMDSPEIRALAELVTEKDGVSTVSDFFRKHIFNRATAHGIMRDGKVQGEWRERIAARAEAIRENKKRRSEARKRAATAKHTKQPKGAK